MSRDALASSDWIMKHVKSYRQLCAPQNDEEDVQRDESKFGIEGSQTNRRPRILVNERV